MAKIEYYSEEEYLVVKGVEGVVNHPLFSAFARQLSGRIENQSVLRVPTRSDQVTEQYRRVAKLLTKLGVSIEQSEIVAEEIRAVERQEKQFEEFSRRAQEIWDAQIDTEEFREFVAVVEQQCPGRTFYRKQLLSAFHLAFSQNACNFSVPGAGKTSVVYAAYAYLRSLPPDDPKSVDRLLIVGPLSSFKAWEDEFVAIFDRQPTSKRISGGVAAQERSEHLRGISIESRKTELTLTTYQTLANVEDDYKTYLKHVGPRTMVVLDEAHYIKKNEDGKWAEAALSLAPLARSRVVLTGTPAPNGYEDLANLFKFLYPDRHIIGFPVASLRAMTDGSMPTAVPELKSKIQPFYTRIKKVDLSLPKVDVARNRVPMREKHSKIYHSLERKVMSQLREQIATENASVRLRARLVRLRQAVVNPALLLLPLERDEDGIFDTGESGDLNVAELEVADLIREFDPLADLERLNVCCSLVGRTLEQQGKVLVWSYFLGNLALLQKVLSGYADFVEVLTGATPSSTGDSDVGADYGTREEIIDRFHATKSSAVLIANPQAVGESISLHKACRTAIYFDRDFNAGRFIQSKDRIHRYNPKGGKTVRYHYLLTEVTVDQDIDRRLSAKEQRLLELVDADDIPLLTATDDADRGDLREILEAYELRKTN
ncbi:DEAD/DEAH box helicase [Ruegeria sp.]|uniref:DEAD/DEAH box helicase n=1 Tax=Ruegeria sp. TaxID=1879320 RepID=UPI003C7EC7B2